VLIENPAVMQRRSDIKRSRPYFSRRSHPGLKEMTDTFSTMECPHLADCSLVVRGFIGFDGCSN